MPTYKKLNSSNSGDILPNVWYGGGSIFDKTKAVADTSYPYTSSIQNNNGFSIKVLIKENNSLKIYSLTSSETLELGNNISLSKIAVMKIE